MDSLYISKEGLSNSSSEIESSIKSCCYEWQDYYRKSQLVSPDMEEGENEALKKLAIEYLKKSLTHTGTVEQQLIKIKSLLFLVKIPDKNLWLSRF